MQQSTSEVRVIYMSAPEGSSFHTYNVLFTLMVLLNLTFCHLHTHCDASQADHEKGYIRLILKIHGQEVIINFILYQKQI